MKALLVSHSNGGGGAGRATQRLFDALDTVGVEVHMYADFKHGDDPRISTIHGPLAEQRRRWRIAIEETPAVLTAHPQPRLFSPGLAGALSAKRIDASDADIVNLHWTGFGTTSIRQLGLIRTPVVWTLHDMWAFTGGSGYDDESSRARWRTGYPSGDRRDDGTLFDVERWVARRKLRHWRRPMHVVTPSRWLAGLTRESALLSEWPVTVIPNPIDTDLFQPIDQRVARLNFGIEPDTTLVLVALGGAIDDPRKGVDLLVDALTRIRTPGVALAVVGPGQPPVGWPTGAIRTHWLGRLDDDSIVAAYNAADVVVVPSRQDNLPQTATEPHACGTPVVAFRIGGLPDIVEHERTGYLADPDDPADLAAGIDWVLADRDRTRRLGERARSRAVDHWSMPMVGRAYANHFEAVANYR